MSKNQKNKVLIIKLGALGDVLRTTFLLQGLKKRYNAQIYWVTKQNALALLKNNKLIDKLLVYNSNLKNELKGMQFELVINLDEEYEACELASAVKAKKIFGAYLDGKKRAYTKDSAVWFDTGLISRFGKKKADELKTKNTRTYPNIICKALGIEPGEPTLELTPEQLEYSQSFKEKHRLNDDDLVIGVNTGAGGRWEMKKWGIDSTAELMDHLINELNAKVILFGGPEEVERNQEILKKTKNKAKVVDAGCNNTLEDFISLVNACQIVVTSDSLALHIATTLKKRVVAFFGPTPSQEIELYCRGEKITSNLDCICCHKKKCRKKKNCMSSISVDNVFQAIKRQKWDSG